MPLVSLRNILSAAELGNYGVGAFNVSDLNQAYAVMQAASERRSPVIVQAIAGMTAYADDGWWWDRLRELVVSYPEVTATLHLDHGRTATDCRRAIDHGFSSVMIDGSRDLTTEEPADYEANVALTAEVVEFAHQAGVSVEGELGTIGGAEAGEAARVEDLVLANPEQAADFVERTGVDALAVAVGTSHGSVKFTDAAMAEGLRISLIGEIKRLLPTTFLVLHGSSSIPPEAVATINQYGGDVRSSSGISADQKKQGIAQGIRKINQGTDSHLEWTAALRKFVATRPSTVEPSIGLAEAAHAMQSIVAVRMDEFGSSGRG